MNRTNAVIRRWLIVAAIGLLALPIIAEAKNPENQGVRYYLSLGTSLAAGIQPDAEGVNRITDDSYTDQLFVALQPDLRKLRHERLGCPGETTVTMVDGGICRYPKGSQLTEALSFLRAHKDKVALVTIDMGVNDVLSSGCITGLNLDVACLLATFDRVAMNLADIVSRLRDAAAPGTRIIGMNYYNTFLAAWLTGPEGQVFAVQSDLLARILNGTLAATYGAFGYPTADVAGAFQSSNFSDTVPFPLPPPNDSVPLNVARLCQYTYMCAPPPVGPNIHANRIGYGVMAGAFLDILAAP